jgi:hypothetical protein
MRMTVPHIRIHDWIPETYEIRIHIARCRDMMEGIRKHAVTLQ